MKNKNLQQAKQAKNDEFYTRLSDIEKELSHYKDFFKDKIVFCNCDDPEQSNFWKYFELNFEFLGLKKLVSTHYKTEKPSYKLELVRDINDDGKIDKLDIIKTPLKQNGDFRSNECIEILKESDVCVSNPPFSLFREYIDVLTKHDKKFLVIGNMNAITYKETFKLIKENKLWLGYTSPREFIQPDKTKKKFGNICWFTNIEHDKRNEELILYKTYKGNENDYPKYDNFDAINVDKTKEIPVDFEGVIGVPISFLDKYNPNQFEIIGQMANSKIDEFNHGYPYVNHNKKYARILIKEILFTEIPLNELQAKLNLLYKKEMVKLKDIEDDKKIFLENYDYYNKYMQDKYINFKIERIDVSVPENTHIKPIERISTKVHFNEVFEKAFNNLKNEKNIK